MRKILLVLLVTILLISFSRVQATPLYGDPPEEDVPLLQVLKWTSNTEVLLGTEIEVFVNITNHSSEWAYNLTIIEPVFSEWFSNNQKLYEEYKWV